jgi:uroporphyrinogen-III decarboxylase
MKIVDAIIERGMIPYLFTEGPYTTRLKFLKELPPAKCLIHFEKIDMALAKRELAGVACITGNFPAWLLETGTPQQVTDEAKRLLDACAPGGGYMFAFDGGMYAGKRANVEALYQTVKEYGRY